MTTSGRLKVVSVRLRESDIREIKRVARDEAMSWHGKLRMLVAKAVAEMLRERRTFR
jgi:predicted DNA binding CopG/RHH family protein